MFGEKALYSYSKITLKMKKILKITLITLLMGVSNASFYACSDDDKTTEAKVEANLNYTFNEITGAYNFTNMSSNAKTYVWEFGDGATSTEVNPSHIYANEGSYTLKLTAISPLGTQQDVLTQTLVAKKAPAVDATLPDGYSLVWLDEFNTDGSPSPQKWNYDIGTGAWGWGNGEAEYYTDRPENARVENGNLVITAKKENYSGSAYTSARLKTKGKYEFKYGKVFVRAKLPVGKGTWPAIWTLGADIDKVIWPGCGEIDIMEHTGNNLNEISSAIHTPAGFGGNPSKGAVKIADANQYHIYSLEWTDKYLKLYVDDTLIHTYDPTKTPQNWPFDKEHFLLLNVAMGGGLGGAIDPAFTEDKMLIDYVRVYQKK